MAETETGRAARAYLARGWSVVPVEPGGKRPLVRWEPLQRRRADEEDLSAWLARRPDANLALVTGAVSGLAVLDVDPRHGGEASLARWEREQGALPETLEAGTGGGGRHLYFAHPGGTLRSRTGLAPGLDLRADGGLVVAPPSRHASGGRYRWRVGRGPEEARPALLPGWLLQLAQGASPPEAEPSAGGADWSRRARQTVPEGGRNDAVASFAGHLLAHGLGPGEVRELLLGWNRLHCRPPLPDEEVARTVESIARTHRRHRG